MKYIRFSEIIINLQQFHIKHSKINLQQNPIKTQGNL